MDEGAAVTEGTMSERDELDDDEVRRAVWRNWVRRDAEQARAPTRSGGSQTAAQRTMSQAEEFGREAGVL